MNSPVPHDPGPNETALTRGVGLGASAAGLAALEQFLANVPLASGLAYIVVQHLDPTHKVADTGLVLLVLALLLRRSERLV